MFATVLLADEINRASPKTQSALLEAMEEGQVTVDGYSHPLGPPFMVIATQNPIELEGTYPLPEAQLDRFLMRIAMGYPDRDAELEILEADRDHAAAAELAPGHHRRRARRAEPRRRTRARRARRCASTSCASPTRPVATPRSSSARAPAARSDCSAPARAWAAAAGRDFVLPDDVKRLAIPVLAHRLLPSGDAELRGVTGRRRHRRAAHVDPGAGRDGLSAGRARHRRPRSPNAAGPCSAPPSGCSSRAGSSAPSELTTLGLCAVRPDRRARWCGPGPGRMPLALVRTLRPGRVQVGGDARVDLELRAAGPTPQVTVTDRFDDGRRAARFITPALERGQPARAAYRIPTDRRGRFTVGPAVVGIADPFGLTHRFVEIGRHRRRDRAAAGARAVGHAPRRPGQRRSSAQRRALVPVPSPAHDEFLALRDYEVGDDLRRIHWRSTARLGELIVREDESAWQPETVIVLDNRAGAHRGGTYEAAIEALASIAVRIGRAGRTVDILTTAGRRLGAVGGEGLRIETLLDELAVLTPDPDAPIAAAIRRLRAPARRGMLVVVTGAPDDLTPFTALAGTGSPVTLVVCGGTSAARRRRRHGGRRPTRRARRRLEPRDGRGPVAAPGRRMSPPGARHGTR